MSEQVFHIGVKALIRNDKGQFLLLVRNNPLKDKNKEFTNWDIPGGRMDLDEDFEDTLARELKEELDVSFNTKPEFITPTLTKIKISTERGEVALVLMIYTLTISNSTKLSLSHEHTDYEWVDMETAIERLKGRYSSDFPGKVRDKFGK